MTQVYLKKSSVRGEILVAACDAELLGKKLRDGALNIVFEVKEAFYNGGRVSIEEAMDVLRQATIANLVGEKIVNRAIGAGLVNPAAVIRIGGVPHAQIVKIS